MQQIKNSEIGNFQLFAHHQNKLKFRGSQEFLSEVGETRHKLNSTRREDSHTRNFFSVRSAMSILSPVQINNHKYLNIIILILLIIPIINNQY